MKRPKRFTAALALTLIFGAGACTDEGAETITAPSFGVVGPEDGPPGVGVYTQNMFLGGDTGPLFSADLSDFEALAAATFVFYNEVQNSDIPGRAAEFVDEVESRLPEVVALQEAVGYVEGLLIPQGDGTFSFQPTEPGPDLLQALGQELGNRLLPYDVIPQSTTTLALPMGGPTAEGIPALLVMDRVALLVHQGVGDYMSSGGTYAATLPLAPGIEIKRGWVKASFERNGIMHHFVSTHLEGQGSGEPGDPVRFVHNQQAAQLQGMLTDLGGNVVLMGDLNSDALADPSERSWTPTYGNLIDAGFVDVWSQAPNDPRDDGATCCFDDRPELNERIDFVLVLHDDIGGEGENGNHRGFYRSDIVGEEMADQTADGLWPSDHAGIVASISRPDEMN